LPNIFMRPDGGSAQSARPRLRDIIMVDRTGAAAGTAAATAEIATLRQKLAAAEARIRETGRPNATEAYKDNAFKRFAPWKSDKTKERMAALLRDPPTLDAGAKTPRATAQVMHGRASESANAAPEWPRLVAVFLAGELGFVGMA
jgi:hypothetical protein